MPQTVTIRVYHTAYSIFTLYSHKISILVANVYNLEEWLLRGSLLPCYKKLVFGHFSCKEENERQILLALYICLEYRTFISILKIYLFSHRKHLFSHRKLCFLIFIANIDYGNAY